MQEKSSAEPPPTRGLASADLSVPARLGMLAGNFVPCVHLLLTGAALLCTPAGPLVRAVIALAVLYLVPALTCRVILHFRPLPDGKLAMGSGPFFTWWVVANLQALFCRFPFLDELLRVFPGLYSAWLRLWGSKIGRLTYWAPGTRLYDRSMLAVGDDVVFGAGVRMSGHLIAREPDGVLRLTLGKVTVGDNAIVGGGSALAPGTEIAEGESTKAFLVSPPFSRWKNGKRDRE
ncbi:MAG: hypothetical protein LAT83_12240 [Kiritimatiellae bacterium]|nr:hypothetical protein [Kiritimatiellia bacterium]